MALAVQIPTRIIARNWCPQDAVILSSQKLSNPDGCLQQLVVSATYK
jgi:hypothetical protein